MSSASVQPLDATSSDPQRVGGKARGLAVMIGGGLPVPPGFVVTCAAYRDFCAAAGIDGRSGDAAAMRAEIEAGNVSPVLAEAITSAFHTLGGAPVAVRSSASAEDLPEASFAGQQDTYLNVQQPEDVVAAVKACWASLWSDRAYAYRERAGIDHGRVAMAVVVQTMVPATVAGIAFTADPVTGERKRLVVNAAFGLGEAIVGGQVTPDTVVIDRSTGQVVTRAEGSKTRKTVMRADGGTHLEEVPPADRDERSLSEANLQTLVAAAEQVERLCDGVPQDIEWAFAGEQLWLLQSRPVTNLPDPPLEVEWRAPREGEKLIRRQIVENMPGPLSPLFDDLYLSDAIERAIDGMVDEFDLPFDLSEMIDRPMFISVNGFGYCRADYRFPLRALPRVLWWYMRSIPRILREMLPRWRESGLPDYLADIKGARALDLAQADQAELYGVMKSLARADARYWFDVSIVVGMAKVMDGLLHLLVGSRLYPGDLTSGMFLQGFDSKTAAAQTALDAMAERLAAVPDLLHTVAGAPRDEQVAALSSSAAGRDVLTCLDAWIVEYGHQVYTLDFCAPTLGEDREGLAASVVARAVAPGRPNSREDRVVARERLLATTAASVGPIRRWLLRTCLRWATRFGPDREEALFYIGAAWPVLRECARELGTRLVADGHIDHPDDVYFLRAAELDAAVFSPQTAPTDLALRAAAQRALRESRLQLHPPAMVPPGSRFRFGIFNLAFLETQKRNDPDSDVVRGFAVSPGVVSGTACVIMSAQEFDQMVPGAILVCPTTTPAWTPLFAHAAGLVTDIGGILAHGSIVAREYGIPAVLGTGDITRRVRSGQRLQVDGTRGEVTIDR